ncbi:G5 domain-containing protein [Micromonospora endolithica]|uniref:G5 domain-containing protein n=1 Tax=Micromonospora endolithica TaxID=230091 RepID=UPI001EDFC15F|nr:G5 domain-containing protein [Micromonospora endolithica]
MTAPALSRLSRLGPGRGVALILGVALSLLLLCCAGTGVLGALVGEPEPKRTDTAADQSPQPVLAGPADADEVAGDTAVATPASPTAAASTVPPSPTAAPSPVVRVRTVTETARVRYTIRTVNDANLTMGKRVIRTRGVDGARTLTYQVTVTDGVQTGKKLVSSVVTRKAVTQVVAVGTKARSNCDPNYSPCVPIASDVDCAGGSGNGPAYVSGPVKVIGSDIYDLDRDNNGYGCDD